ncbi:MAG: sulfotransferase [Deltaproteobacteria bacterium]|nr:sulfotransferase [Deltaproteobacteria bacterium]
MEKTRRYKRLMDIAQLIRLTVHKPIIEFNARVGPVLVFGSARGGTTWMADVISKMTRARQIFEPFLLHRAGYFLFTAHRDPTEANCDLNYELYIRPESPSCRYKDQIADILFKPHRNSWCDKMCRHGIYRKRLIKDIRANLFMAYIAHNWPSLKILWVVRNPVDVVESQVAMRKVGYPFDWNIGHIKSQPELLHDWLSPFLPEMEAAKSLPERLCHKWCIENFIPFKQGVASRPNVLLVRYDNLVAGPQQWEPIMRFLGCGGYDAGILGRETAKPSKVSRKVVLGPGSRQERKHLCPEDMDYIERTVRLYGLDGLLSTA